MSSLHAFDFTDLRSSFEALQKSEPRLHLRSIAQRLRVPEVVLTPWRTDATTWQLRGEMQDILARLVDLGPVMTMTRNDYAVLEKLGACEGWHPHSHAAMFVGPVIDTRMFIGKWQHAMISHYEHHGRPQRSLQFFDIYGDAVFKVFATKDTDNLCWQALLSDFAVGELSSPPPCEVRPAPIAPVDIRQVDRETLIKAWDAVEDIHHFQSILKKFKLDRLSATRAVNDVYSRPLGLSAASSVLEAAADKQIPIMIFVGNHANIQIHTGLITKTAWRGEWFNILDFGFNLHLDTTGISEI
ncbi:MAG: hypothetical protein EA401_13035, partial [Planctomycetota bacterium]